MSPLRTVEQTLRYPALLFACLGFALTARADTDAHLSADDMRLTDKVRLRHEKGRRRRLPRLELPCSIADGFLYLAVDFWLRGLAGLRHVPAHAAWAATKSFWQTPFESAASATPPPPRAQPSWLVLAPYWARAPRATRSGVRNPGFHYRPRSRRAHGETFVTWGSGRRHPTSSSATSASEYPTTPPESASSLDYSLSSSPDDANGDLFYLATQVYPTTS
jgi:hypothetical protein